MNRRFLLLAVLAALALPGCDGTPTQLEGGTQVFEGTVETLGSNSHLFTVTTTGGVQINVLSVTAEPEIEVGTPNLGLGIGEPNDDGVCATTFRTTAATGTIANLGLEERTYCVTLFDNGTMAEDALRHYEVQVNATAS